MKKFLTMLLCLTVAFCAFGCPKPEDDVDDSETTVLTIPYSSGGIGKDWITGPAARFGELRKNHSYAEGKTGVVIKAVEGGASASNVLGSTFDIIGFDRVDYNPIDMAANGSAICLDEAFTTPLTEFGETKTVAEKIDPAFADFFKGADGRYYGIPCMEYYGGLTYDPVTYVNYGLYIAACNVTGENDAEFELNHDNLGFTFGSKEEGYANDYGMVKYESSYFGIDLYLAFGPGEYNENTLEDELPKDSFCVGPNGIKGDYDDGLPSSVYELIALCDYMKSEGLCSPFALSGEYQNYSNMFSDGLYHSLAGNYDGYSIMTLDTQGREIEVITGWSNEKLFPNCPELAHLHKPITKKVKVTEQNGYYTNWMVARYWGAAFLEIAATLSWYNPSFTEGLSHRKTHERFIFGNYDTAPGVPPTAFLMEGSFWNNEARFMGWYDDLYEYKYPLDHRDFKWMPLPVTVDIPVIGEINYTTDTTNIPGTYDEDAYKDGFAGHAPTIIDVTRSFYVINGKLKNNPEKLEAAIDYVRFIMTDPELTYYAIESGCFRPMKFEIDESIVEGKAAWNVYMQSLWNVKKDAYTVYYNFNASFEKSKFYRGFLSGAYSIGADSLSYMDYRKYDLNFHDYWEKTMWLYSTGTHGDGSPNYHYYNDGNGEVKYTNFKTTFPGVDYNKQQ
ncbi:MAG: hypothetical protein IKL82_04425 [Clostridia bacterium]|nr:hypothetical protein [Clostridia bacterium]